MQKPAYEMRISDRSSDVCSSDLAQPVRRQRRLKRTLTAVLENGPTESEASRMRYLMRGTKEELAVQLIQAERRLKTSNSANALIRNTMLKRSEENTSARQSLMRISYAVFCLKKQKNICTLK